MAALSIAAGACRFGFDAAIHPDGPSDDTPGDGAVALVFVVCASGCAFSTIQAAIDEAVSAPNPQALPVIVEVRGNITYAGNLVIPPPASGAPLTLRAAPASLPVISASGGEATLSIDAPGVTVSGFMFAGKALRGVWVTRPDVTLDHDFFSADFGTWNPDQYFRGTGVLLTGDGSAGAKIVNNTFYDCEEAIEIIDAATAGNVVVLRNNIFVQLTQNRPELEPILWFKPSVDHYALASDYNLFYYTGSECIAWDNTAGPITTLDAWRGGGHDSHGIGTSVDPLLASPDAYDFHERSAGGRYQPGGSLVIDAVTSLAVDHGDPADPVGAELAPNGNLINLGAYGGTAEASLTP